MPHDVFISHSTVGRLTANAICNELESSGIRCWILPRDLNIGIAWDQSIANAVASCRVMIVVFSDYASRSDRVERQLELAFNSGVMVIPFRTESSAFLGQSQPALDSLHWLDATTPEMARRLRSLCDQVRSLILRPTDEPLAVGALAVGLKERRQLTVDGIADSPQRITGPPQPDASKDEVQLSANYETVVPLDPDSAKNSPPTIDPLNKSELTGKESVLRQPEKTAKWRLIKALLLTLVPFAAIFGAGIWHTKKGPKPRPAKPFSATTAPIGARVADKVWHEDKFPASDPGWGTPDANWTAANGKLRITPLPNNSAVLINHSQQLKDAEITAEIVMSKGEDLDQLGGLIFWAKDYNDCYALVVSADGKFALGRKLIGRWINPIAKTGNAAIKTGIGQTNKLRVRMEGSLLTASINGIQVATLTGQPPQGVSYIGLYGESAERTQNVWEFFNVTVTSVN